MGKKLFVLGLLLSIFSIEMPQSALAAKKAIQCRYAFSTELPVGAVTDSATVERTLSSLGRRWNNAQYFERGFMDTEFKEVKYQELGFNGMPRAMEISSKQNKLVLESWRYPENEKPKKMKRTIPVDGKIRSLGKNALDRTMYRRAYLMPVTDTKNGNTEHFPYTVVIEELMEGETDPVNRFEMQFWFEPQVADPNVISIAIVKAAPALEITKTTFGTSANRIRYAAVAQDQSFPPAQAADVDPMTQPLPKDASFDLSKIATFAGDWELSELQVQDDQNQWVKDDLTDPTLVGFSKKSSIQLSGNTITSIDDGKTSTLVVDGTVQEHTEAAPDDDQFIGPLKIQTRAYISADGQLVIQQRTKSISSPMVDDFSTLSVSIDANGNLVEQHDQGLLGVMRAIKKRAPKPAN